jgi:hypothetical protein
LKMNEIVIEEKRKILEKKEGHKDEKREKKV